MKKLKKLLFVMPMALIIGSCSPQRSEVENAKYEIYKLAQEAGFEGTFEEWLASIQGPQGEKGDKGDTGAQGEKGDKGDTGAQGEKGDKGDKGDTGETGPQGPKGDKGDTGTPGTDGTDGLTPCIGENGNWWIGDTDTGVKASGDDATHANEKCTVTFVLNGGVLPEGYSTTMTVDYGSTMVLPIPTNEYASIFEGWYTGSTINDGQFFNYSPICTNITLTARWAYTLADIENGCVDVSPKKDIYYFGEEITVTPKNLANKTFSLYNFDVVNNDGSTFGSYSNKYEISTTVGKYVNFNVQYIDTPSTISEFAGTYTGEFINFDNEAETISIIIDGYGLYEIEGEKYSILSYLDGKPVAYDPSKTSGYLIEDPVHTFNNVSFYKEIKDDGIEYTYFTTDYDSYSGMETTTFWLDGNAYVEKEDTVCPAAGTFTATFYDSDSESDVTWIATINEDGTGSTDEDGYVQSFTVIDTSNFPESFTIETEAGDEKEIVLQADGTYKGRFGDGKSQNYTFEKYVFPFAGTFTGTDADDIVCKIEINEDKTGAYYEDGVKVYDLKVTEFSYPESLTVAFDDYGEEVTKTITLLDTGYYKARLGESSVVNYEFAKKTACPYAGTFEGVDGDETTCKLVINADSTGSYYEDGTLLFTFKITEIINDGTIEKFVIEAEDGETYNFTKQANGTFKGRVNNSVIYTFTPAA